MTTLIEINEFTGRSGPCGRLHCLGGPRCQITHAFGPICEAASCVGWAQTKWHRPTTSEQRESFTGAVGILIDPAWTRESEDEPRLLWARRSWTREDGSRRPRAGLWEFPGGRVETVVGESVYSAVEREWQEELGLSVVAGICIAQCSLQVEIDLTLVFMQVRLAAGSELADVKLTSHDDWRLATLDEMITYFPCCPGQYLTYRAVRDFLKTR